MERDGEETSMRRASLLNELSATDAVAAIREKRIRAVELAEACLARIRLRQPEVRAWASIDEALVLRSEEHTSELQSLMRISYAVFCLKKKTQKERHEYQESKEDNSHIR